MLNTATTFDDIFTGRNGWQGGWYYTQHNPWTWLGEFTSSRNRRNTNHPTASKKGSCPQKNSTQKKAKQMIKENLIKKALFLSQRGDFFWGGWSLPPNLGQQNGKNSRNLGPFNVQKNHFTFDGLHFFPGSITRGVMGFLGSGDFVKFGWGKTWKMLGNWQKGSRNFVLASCQLFWETVCSSWCCSIVGQT